MTVKLRTFQPLALMASSLATILATALVSIPLWAQSGGDYDLVLRNARIVDGSGNAAYTADVGIRDGRIATIGGLGGAAADETVDLGGLVLAPGFIDLHNHADRGLTDPALKTNKGFITQGVTTTIFGVDGAYSPDEIGRLRSAFDTQGIGTNYMFYVGHNGVRRAVMGMENRAPTADELQRMKDMVRSAMDDGAIGLSSGLMYLPGNFAETDELIALGRVAGRYGGLYSSHVRDPAHNLIESINECLTIAWHAGLSAHPTHLKAVGAKNFGTSQAVIDLIENWQARGLGVTADLYPYDGAATAKLVEIVVPPADSEIAGLYAQYFQTESSEERARIAEKATNMLRETLQDPSQRDAFRRMTEDPPDGTFSWVTAVGYGSYRIVVSDTPEYVGRMLTEVADEQEQAPFDLIADLIISEGSRTKITLGAIQEPDVQALMKQPWAMVSSDGSITGFENGGGHPRHRGSFPRVMGRYVREWGVLGLEQAVYKVSALPAIYLQLRDRGLVREGYWADLAVFDPDRIIDRSTWETPDQFSEGVEHVLVNGQFALRGGDMTGQTHGRYLRFRDSE